MAPTLAVVTTWFGAFLVDGDQLVRSETAPIDPSSLAARIAERHAGRLTPEEEHLLATRGNASWTTRDRRVGEHGPRWDSMAPAGLPPSASAPETSLLRDAMLLEAERALASAWDPSVHVEEAVRAVSDLDRVQNLLGERLGSWVARDAPEIDPGDHASAARRALETTDNSPFGPAEPAVRAARRRMAELYRSVEAARAELASAVNAAVPTRTPNLSALLGPDLAARILAQAGGLDRLARLPASTVQVLGAEKAFFEHLRGRAPPPRHGLLFLHPAIQSAPRHERGKLARTLAGKAAIAARLDRAGAPLDPTLAQAFEARRARLKGARGSATVAGRRSGKPLHRAARDG
jgi:nucleolar protein 56